jgi:hypothetical protein
LRPAPIEAIATLRGIGTFSFATPSGERTPGQCPPAASRFAAPDFTKNAYRLRVAKILCDARKMNLVVSLVLGLSFRN